MKKLLILSCVCMICLSACTSIKEEQMTSNETAQSIATQEFGENKDNENKQGGDGSEDINGNEDSKSESSMVGSDENDSAKEDIDKIIESMRDQLGYYQDMVHTPAVDQTLFEIGLPLTNDKIRTLNDREIQKILSDLSGGGYKIIDRGEYYDVQINFEYLMEISRDQEGPSRDFIEICYYFDDFNHRLLSKSSINMDEYVSMIARVENHLTQWPESKYTRSLNALFKNQIMIYYLGNNDYQVFDFTTNKMKEDSLKLMKKHVKEYIDSSFAQIGMKYLLQLESNEYAYHPEYIQLIDSYKKFGLSSDLRITERKTLDHTKSVFLPEILGHDNLTIGESINQILRDEVTHLMQETGYSDESDGTFYFNTYIYSATDKILSIECMASHNLKDWTLDKSAATTFNFDLATGEPLTLERLFDEDTKSINSWMLPIVNAEFEKYFGSETKLGTLENAQYVIQQDAILVLGKDATHRVYIPRWVLKDYVSVEDLFH